MERSREVAVVVGVGPGLGAALALCFARAEMHVALVARGLERLEGLASDCTGVNHRAIAIAADSTDESAVEGAFDRIERELGTPRLVVYNAGAFVRRSILETSVEDFERCWRVGCLGGFLVGRAAARRMLAATTASGDALGSVIFTGATASLRGGPLFHNLAVGKFGLRALAQSMARELQPRGIHVAHVVVDGQIAQESDVSATGADNRLDPNAIAANYLVLHRQARSAWTHELDLRPWVEKF